MLSSNVPNKKIVFLVPYPLGTAPGQRFRYEQYFDQLLKQNFTWIIHSFLDDKTYRVLYQSGKSITKFFGILKGFLLRFVHLFDVARADYIFIYREASPAGPPVFEWIIAKVLRKKIIYDFDDAIWLTDKINESRFEKIIRWRSKVKRICQWSYKVSCGNEYLCSYARQFSPRVVYNPTTIDTDLLHNPDLINNQPGKTITIGWTGSHSTLKYLAEVEPALLMLEIKYPQLEILIIANQKPDLKLQSLKFLPWTKETEAEDLAKIDIGIMPLPDDEWTNGKCGFKALQYMAMRVPAIVSPVGVNTTIIEPGITGFHAATADEWFSTLEKLITNESLRIKMGEAGRQKVIDHYSISSNTSTFLSLFS